MFSFALALLFVMALPGSDAFALTRSEVINRAKAWTDSRVPYSQTRTFKGYRADCSGFVSYALSLKKPGQTTVTLAKTMKPIRKQDLKPGDILVASGVHTVMFGGWANRERTKYVAYEQSASSGSVRRVTPYPYWKGAGKYAPKRHPQIKDGGSSSSGTSLSSLRAKLIRKKSDFNGDGLSDIAFLYDSPYDRRSLWHFYTAKAGFSPVNVWTGNYGAFDAKRAKMTSGDFNGDNIADTAFLYRNPDNSTSIWIFYSNRGGRSVRTANVWTSKPGGFDWERVKMASGDFNGSGRDDLVFFHGDYDGRSAIWMFLSKKDGGFETRKWWQSEVGAFNWERAKMVTGDFNGNGLTDLAFLYDYVNSPTTMWVFTTNKSGGFSPRVWWKANPGTFLANRIKMVSGYFNADNYADIAMFYDEPSGRSSIITLNSGGARFVNPSKKWTSEPGAFKWDRAKIMSGDFNGNGLSDLAFLHGYANDQSVAWMFENNSGSSFFPRRWWTGVAGNYNWEGAMSIDQGLTEDRLDYK